MSTARDRVINTAELLQLILLALPFDELLRARQVSKGCRDLINRSKYLRQIQAQPYVGVHAQLPRLCSISQDPPPYLTVHFTLYFDKPITIYLHPVNIKHISTAFYKFEDGDSTVSALDFPRGMWGSKHSSRPHRFKTYTAHTWITLYPGVPRRVKWNFRRYTTNSQPMDGNMRFTEVGKVYTLRLRSDKIGHLLGTKKSLLTRLENGEDLGNFLLDKPLKLITENEVRFTAVP